MCTALGAQVQRTLGVSDYVRRDMALKNLIQPLAGEYGMHNGQPQRECPGREREGGAWEEDGWVRGGSWRGPGGGLGTKTVAVAWAALRWRAWRGSDGARPTPPRPAVKTHRELFSDFFASLFGYGLEELLADSPQPQAATVGAGGPWGPAAGRSRGVRAGTARLRLRAACAGQGLRHAWPGHVHRRPPPRASLCGRRRCSPR